MEKKPLPEVVCPHCHMTQIWRGQRNCIARGCAWTNWFHANLLKYAAKPVTDYPFTQPR